MVYCMLISLISIYIIVLWFDCKLVDFNILNVAAWNSQFARASRLLILMIYIAVFVDKFLRMLLHPPKVYGYGMTHSLAQLKEPWKKVSCARLRISAECYNYKLPCASNSGELRSVKV